MANKAVFLDRDHTLIEDPGYLADPNAVKLLPGVDLALKSLTAGGFKTVVVTNQSAVARGLVTEETLGLIHDELCRQLAEKGTHLDAIYYCPYHPEGTVEGYAIESELRKPQPGMLLKAAVEMDIDLKSSWMVGDNARDIEAGQRAGCRTIRLRPSSTPLPGEVSQEDVQPDFTARNLVEATRIILRESGYTLPHPVAAPPETPTTEATAPILEEPIAPLGIEAPAAAPMEEAPVAALTEEEAAAVLGAEAPVAAPVREGITPPAPSLPVKEAAPPPPPPPPPSAVNEQVLREILRYVRQIAHIKEEEFSVVKVLAGIAQVLAVLGLVLALWRLATDQMDAAILWAQIATVFQVMALTFFAMRR